jgi:ABC-type Mn2+/Zn2+ transport system ATPase subunit
MSDVVAFRNVTLGYRGHPVVEGLTFAVREGEFFGIVGANGSGKTTILRALLGILRPRSGQIETAYRHFGYVPQRSALDDIFPLSVGEIVALACPRGDITAALEQTGTAGLATRLFRDLSGGQKQRVLIARALASAARVLVLDEPTDGMDLEGQHGILQLIGRLRATTSITVIYVTHRLNELSHTADRLMLLHEGVTRIGPVAEILSETTLREVYGLSVRIVEIHGQRLVLP